MIRIRRIAAHNFKQLKEVDLYLPPSGRFLVQGKNEAGKSTLFEAVYFGLFGQPLVTESGSRGADDLINYGAERARVELWVEAPGRTLRVTRTIIRDKPNVWELVIESPRGLEEVRGNNAINQRIVRELGFDGEALLNTCFVEQKKLEKLEGMTRQKREESLMRLLNLDQMIRIEQELKIRREDQLALERARRRADLARIQTTLPQQEHALELVEGKLLFVELRRLTRELVDERRAVQTLGGEIASLVRERDSLAERASRVEQLKEAGRNVREVQTCREQALAAAQETARIQAEIQAIERTKAEDLPALKLRLQTLQRLQRHLQRLNRIQAVQVEEQAHVIRLQQVLNDRQDLQRQLAAHQARQLALATDRQADEARLDELGRLLHALDERDALRDWLDAYQAVSAPARREEELAARQQAREALFEELKAELVRLEQVAPRGLVPLLASLALFVQWLVQVWFHLSRLAEDIGYLRGAQQTLVDRAESERDRLATVEARLADLGIPVPATVEAAETRLATLVAETAGVARATLVADQSASRDRLIRTRTLSDEVARAIAELEGRLAGLDETAVRAEIDQAQRRMTKAGRILAIWRPRTQSMAQNLGSQPELAALAGILGRLQAQMEDAQRRMAELPSLQADAIRRQADAAGWWQRGAEIYASIQAVLPEAPAWDPDAVPEVYAGLQCTLRTEYDALGGEQVRRDLERISNALGNKQGEMNARQQHATQLLVKAREILGQLGLKGELGTEEPELEQLEALLARLQQLDLGDEGELRRQRDQLQQEVGHLRRERDRLENDLGLEGELLDVETCQREWEAKRRELAVRERAQRIVEIARRRVVEKILPSTMEHMRQLLPTLTMQRYYDAELTDDYRIRVWDERAGDQGAWKEKNIFSGGTKDQFSLALRLAFALATLPSERGSAPSFIFLDEPLSSFDQDRAQALLYLLTEGEVAQCFDQVFLISHISVNPSLFNFQIILDGGRVKNHNLPSPVEAGDIQPALAMSETERRP